MNIIFKTETDLIMGEFANIIASSEINDEEGSIIITFYNYGNQDILKKIVCDKDKVSKILSKIYMDISQNNGICILSNDILGKMFIE